MRGCCDGCDTGWGCYSGMSGIENMAGTPIAFEPYSYAGLFPLPMRISPNGLGAIPQQMPTIAGGSPFAFGYNTGYFAGMFKPEDVAHMLEYEAGLGYDVRSYQVAGMLNPYVTVEGNAVTTWPNAADLGQAIYNAIRDASFPIDYASIQFRVEPYVGPGASGPPPAMVGTPYPGTKAPGVPVTPSGGCDWATQGFADYLACQLGVTPTTAMVVGAIGALIGVVVLTKR